MLQNSILHQLRQNHGGDIQPGEEDHQGKGDRGADCEGLFRCDSELPDVSRSHHQAVGIEITCLLVH